MFTFYYKTEIGYLEIVLIEDIINKKSERWKIISCIFVDGKNENKKEGEVDSAAEGGAIESQKIQKLKEMQEIQKEISLELNNYFKNKKDFSKHFLRKYIDINNLYATDFQKEIWKVISKVKIGNTINYTQMAEGVGRPRASRAAGSACSKNPLALFIPCHRVLRKDGEVNYKDRGYSWGTERKTWLLEYEGYVFR